MTTKYLGESAGLSIFASQDEANDNGVILLNDPYEAAEQRFLQEAMRLMLEFYPGYGWNLRADVRQGILTVGLPTFMGAVLQWVIHLDKVQSPQELEKKIRAAGGEILERLKLARGKLNQSEYLDAIAALPSVQKHVVDLPV